MLRDNTAGKILHPASINGKTVWTDGSIQEFVAVLQQGDPTSGWEGDPFLCLLAPDETGAWEVVRLDGDRYNTVARSKPPHKLDGPSFVRALMEQDHRRKSWDQQMKERRAHNAAIDKAKRAAEADRAAAALEKVYFAVDREVGHHY